MDEDPSELQVYERVKPFLAQKCKMTPFMIVEEIVSFPDQSGLLNKR